MCSSSVSCTTKTCDGSCFQLSTLELYVVYSFSSFISFKVFRRSLIYLTYFLSVVIYAYCLFCYCLNWSLTQHGLTPRALDKGTYWNTLFWPCCLHNPFCRGQVILVSPTISLETCSAAPVTQLLRVTFVINQILKQVEPATSNVTHSGKKMTQSW